MKRFVIALLLTLGLTVSAQASDWRGAWRVADSSQQSFYITLFSGGAAAGSLEGGMIGSWSVKNGDCVVEWDSGWVTILSHEDGGTVKRAWSPTKAMNEPPSNTSIVERFDSVPWSD